MAKLNHERATKRERARRDHGIRLGKVTRSQRQLILTLSRERGVPCAVIPSTKAGATLTIARLKAQSAPEHSYTPIVQRRETNPMQPSFRLPERWRSMTNDEKRQHVVLSATSDPMVKLALRSRQERITPHSFPRLSREPAGRD